MDHVRRLESTAELFFGKGLFIYVFGWLVAFAGVGFAVASLFEWGVGDKGRDQNLRNILLPVDFIISWIYFLLLRDAIEGYTSAAEAYTRMLTLGRAMASRTLALTEHGAHVLLREEGVTLRKPPPPALPAPPPVLPARARPAQLTSRARPLILPLGMIHAGAQSGTSPSDEITGRNAGSSVNGEESPLYNFAPEGPGSVRNPTVMPRLTPSLTQGYSEFFDGSPYGPSVKQGYRPESIPEETTGP